MRYCKILGKFFRVWQDHSPILIPQCFWKSPQKMYLHFWNSNWFVQFFQFESVCYFGLIKTVFFRGVSLLVKSVKEGNPCVFAKPFKASKFLVISWIIPQPIQTLKYKTIHLINLAKNKSGVFFIWTRILISFKILIQS